MQCTTFTLAGLVLMAFAAAAHGQGYPAIGSQPASISVYDHASTAAEGYLRGAADLGRAEGQWMLNYSQACVNMGEANRRGIDNHAASVRNWFQLREENRLRRAAEHRPLNVSPGQQPVAKKSVPARPAAIQLTRSGQVDWPSALRGAAFAADRTRVDAVLARWASGRRPTLADREALHDVHCSMLTELKSQIRELSAPDYLTAVRCAKALTKLESSVVATGYLLAQ